MAFAHGVEAAAHIAQRFLLGPLSQVVVFGDANDDVHHIRKTAAADAALAELMVDLGRDDQLPWILVEKIGDDPLDIPIRDDVAVADEHGGQWRCRSNPAVRPV